MLSPSPFSTNFLPSRLCSHSRMDATPKSRRKLAGAFIEVRGARSRCFDSLVTFLRASPVLAGRSTSLTTSFVLEDFYY